MHSTRDRAPVPRGWCAVHDGATWHAGAHITKGRRAALVAQFVRGPNVVLEEEHLTPPSQEELAHYQKLQVSQAARCITRCIECTSHRAALSTTSSIIPSLIPSLIRQANKPRVYQRSSLCIGKSRLCSCQAQTRIAKTL